MYRPLSEIELEECHPGHRLRWYSSHQAQRCSMTRLRHLFTAEFKLEATSLVLDQGYSVPEASRSLDVGETVLRRWVQQLQSERAGTTPIDKALTLGQQKIQELEARINRLEREKDILKNVWSAPYL